MNETNETSPPQRVECPPSREPAVRLFIIAGMLLAFGLWCAYEYYILGEYHLPTDTEPTVNDYAGYVFNAWGGVVLPLAGLVPLAMGILFLRRKLVADAEGITPPGGSKIAWSDVTKLDASDLAGKGILRLEHGADKPLVLDSWKLQNFKALVAFVETHVPAEAVQAEKEKEQDSDRA